MVDAMPNQCQYLVIQLLPLWTPLKVLERWKLPESSNPISPLHHSLAGQQFCTLGLFYKLGSLLNKGDTTLNSIYKLRSPPFHLCMAASKLFLGSLLLFVLALHVAESHRLLEVEPRKLSEETGERNTVGETASATGIDCGASCAVRCSKSSRPNLCKRACGTCCFRCSCVPPGTYGNYDSCPCYASLTTRGGARKCP